MKLVTILVALAALAVVPAFADGNFLVKYVTNLPTGDSSIFVTNTGASWGQNLQMAGGTPFLPSNGNLCVNVYVFTPDEQEAECCSCLATPNGLYSFSAKTDLTSNPLTGVIVTDAVIKLVATAACTPDTDPTSKTFGSCKPTTSAASCNAATAGQTPFSITYASPFPNPTITPGIIGTLGQPLAGGLSAWGTTLHANTSTSPATYQVTETPFDNANLSARELNRLTNLCFNIQQNGSGSGICAHDHQACALFAGPH